MEQSRTQDTSTIFRNINNAAPASDLAKELQDRLARKARELNRPLSGVEAMQIALELQRQYPHAKH